MRQKATTFSGGVLARERISKGLVYPAIFYATSC